jgi:hypothetical protein
MREQGGSRPPELPEPDDIIERIAKELSLDPQKKPALFEGLPEEQLFPEEAPTFDGRYIAGACLEQIYSLVLKYTPPNAPILLSRGDVRWLHREFLKGVKEAWDLPEPVPDFTLTHLLGATKRQIAHLSELKRFHESEVFDPALRTYSQIAFVTERAILDCDPDPQYLGDEVGDDNER